MLGQADNLRRIAVDGWVVGRIGGGSKLRHLSASAGPNTEHASLCRNDMAFLCGVCCTFQLMPSTKNLFSVLKGVNRRNV